MKHNTLEWVIFTLKSVVSALFFVFAFYGAMGLWLLTQQTTINQAALAGIWTQHTLAAVIGVSLR
ncbi:Uncharacterised protein [Weissella viridescens]|uniref:Uncharacterized protein n=1 Tax=Weissella viridescens TaxID=1629 RepID=A0A380NWS1_WEIVI|nr:Uncharacterised protein [Weissella viridescens]